MWSKALASTVRELRQGTPTRVLTWTVLKRNPVTIFDASASASTLSASQQHCKWQRLLDSQSQCQTHYFQKHQYPHLCPPRSPNPTRRHHPPRPCPRLSTALSASIHASASTFGPFSGDNSTWIFSALSSRRSAGPSVARWMARPATPR